MTGRWRQRAIGGAASALALVALAAPLAVAAEISRDEYKATVEPICKRNTEANKRIFKGAKAEVKAGKLKQASQHFFRAAVALRKTNSELGEVPQPTADEARLAKWLDYLGVEASYLDRIGAALKKERKAQAQALAVRLNRNSNLANNAVLPFGFRYCKIQPGRFS